MSKPYRCPICAGCGNVPGGFYNVSYNHVEQYTSANSQEPCRACGGSGIVYGNEDAEQKDLDKLGG